MENHRGESSVLASFDPRERGVDRSWSETPVRAPESNLFKSIEGRLQLRRAIGDKSERCTKVLLLWAFWAPFSTDSARFLHGFSWFSTFLVAFHARILVRITLFLSKSAPWTRTGRDSPCPRRAGTPRGRCCAPPCPEQQPIPHL